MYGKVEVKKMVGLWGYIFVWIDVIMLGSVCNEMVFELFFELFFELWWNYLNDKFDFFFKKCIYGIVFLRILFEKMLLC